MSPFAPNGSNDAATDYQTFAKRFLLRPDEQSIFPTRHGSLHGDFSQEADHAGS